MTHQTRKPRQFGLFVLATIACGAYVGAVAAGFVAWGEMLGGNEQSPAIEQWMAVGAIIGSATGLLTGGVAMRAWLRSRRTS